MGRGLFLRVVIQGANNAQSDASHGEEHASYSLCRVKENRTFYFYFFVKHFEGKLKYYSKKKEIRDSRLPPNSSPSSFPVSRVKRKVSELATGTARDNSEGEDLDL